MAETTAPPPSAMTPAEEEASFYHESALNASWTGVRLAVGALTFLFGAFVFAFFYLQVAELAPPVVSNWRRVLQPAEDVARRADHGAWSWSAPRSRRSYCNGSRPGRRRPGRPARWSRSCSAWLRSRFQIYQLANLPFWPGSSGFASVFVGFWPGLPDARCSARWCGWKS